MELTMWSNTDIAFAAILESLAKFFGTTVEYVQANLGPFLEQYANYAFFGNLPELIFISFLIAGALTGGFIFAWTCMIEKEFTKGPITFAILFFLIVLALPIGVELGKLWAMPEMYGLENLIQALKAAG